VTTKLALNYKPLGKDVEVIPRPVLGRELRNTGLTNLVNTYRRRSSKSTNGNDYN
jgi:hypothetical protein